MSVCVIIPAFNEAERIGNMLDTYLAYFDKNIKFLVVLNGCVDNTEQVVKERQVDSSNLEYIVIDESQGKGHAVRQGFVEAQSSDAKAMADKDFAFRADIIGFVDADGSTSPEEFAKILDQIKNSDNDVVIASRYAPGAQVMNRNSWLRRLSAAAFQKMVRLITGLKFYDTQCGAKVFTSKVIDRILPELKINDMAFDVEILLACQRNNFKILEVATVWQETENKSRFFTSKFKIIKTAFKMLKSIFLLK